MTEAIFSPTPEEVAVRAWVLLVIGPPLPGGITDVFYSNQKGPRPGDLPSAYATILQLVESQTGELERQYADDGGGDAIERIDTRTQASFSITIYGNGHTDLARRLRDSTYQQAVIDANTAAGIVVSHTLGGPTRLSRDSDGVTEDRTVIDFAIRYATRRESPYTDLIENLAPTQNLTPAC